MSLGSGEITAICTAVVTVIGAIATFIYKVRGRSWREVFKTIMEGKSEELKETINLVHKQAEIIKDIAKKELEKKPAKK